MSDEIMIQENPEAAPVEEAPVRRLNSLPKRRHPPLRRKRHPPKRASMRCWRIL